VGEEVSAQTCATGGQVNSQEINLSPRFPSSVTLLEVGTDASVAGLRKGLESPSLDDDGPRIIVNNDGLTITLAVIQHSNEV